MTHQRPRGLAAWRPQRRTLPLLNAVRDVLDEYADFLPLTLRQVFYRLVATRGYEKSENAYERLGNMLGRARRSGVIPFDALRDDSGVEYRPDTFHGMPHFWNAVEQTASGYRRDLLASQPYAIELWCEAAGMAPTLANVVDDYCVPVYSSGGFDSLTLKHEAAHRIGQRDRRTIVLYVGDHDQSGKSMYEAVDDDVTALHSDLAYLAPPDFTRVAITPEQITRYGLETQPPKASDRRGAWEGGTVQAEALPPNVLVTETIEAVRRLLDLDAFAKEQQREKRERTQLVRAVKAMTGGGGTL